MLSSEQIEEVVNNIEDLKKWQDRAVESAANLEKFSISGDAVADFDGLSEQCKKSKKAFKKAEEKYSKLLDTMMAVAGDLGEEEEKALRSKMEAEINGPREQIEKARPKLESFLELHGAAAQLLGAYDEIAGHANPKKIIESKTYMEAITGFEMTESKGKREVIKQIRDVYKYIDRPDYRDKLNDFEKGVYDTRARILTAQKSAIENNSVSTLVEEEKGKIKEASFYMESPEHIKAVSARFSKFYDVVVERYDGMSKEQQSLMTNVVLARMKEPQNILLDLAKKIPGASLETKPKMSKEEALAQEFLKEHGPVKGVSSAEKRPRSPSPARKVGKTKTGMER